MIRVRHRLLGAALALLIGLLLAAPASAQQPPPDLPTYTGWLREAFAAAQRNDRIGLEDAAGRIVAAAEVRLPDGATVAASNTWLRDAVGQADPDFPLIARRLGAIIDALAQPDSAAPEDARARLARLLSEPPFARPAPADTSWLANFFDWLFRALERLLRPLGSTSSTTRQGISWLIAIVGGLLLLAVIGYLLLGLRRNLAAEAQIAADPEANLTAGAARDQAGDLARSGDYRAAMRYLYLSALLWLDERGALRYDRALTNREYLEQVRDRPALVASLAPVVETFDRVWYGHAALTAETFAAYRAQVDELRKTSG